MAKNPGVTPETRGDASHNESGYSSKVERGLPKPEIGVQFSVPAPSYLFQRLKRGMKVTQSGCWEWQGAVDPSGYGAIKVNGKKRNAHRAMYELAAGPIPRARVVCHRCSNHRCINPDHLYAGSRKANLQDAVDAGRDVRCNKLSRDQVITIYRDERPAAEIRAEYDLAVSTVYKIKGKRLHRKWTAGL